MTSHSAYFICASHAKKRSKINFVFVILQHLQKTNGALRSALLLAETFSNLKSRQTKKGGLNQEADPRAWNDGSSTICNRAESG